MVVTREESHNLELGQVSAKPREKTECSMGSFKDIGKLVEGM